MLKSCMRPVLCCLAALAVTVTWIAAPSASQLSDEALLRRLEAMLGVMKQARERHVARPQARQLLDGAMRGMLAQLDPETAFYSPAEYRALLGHAATHTADLGLIVRREPVAPRGGARGLKIIGANEGTPAARAGLRAGDVITHVDGRPAGELGPDSLLANRLHGPAGRVIELWVQRRQTREGHVLLLEVEAPPAIGPEVRRLEGGRLLIRVPSLETGMSAAILARVTAALATGGSASAVILDIRNLGRGSLDEAVALADGFLDAGIIASLDSRRAGAARVFRATPGDVIGGRPLAVLVNAGTARVGEVVAAALQENRRATVIGQPTAGFANQQSFLRIGSGASRGVLHLTTGRYLTPGGRSLEKSGIKPDFAVSSTPTAACRDTDIPDEAGAGLCVRRPDVADAAIIAALSHLTTTSAVATRP